MNHKKQFSIVLPLDEATQDMARQESSRNKLRAILWSQAAEHMKPLLGKTCSSFTPALLPVALPYGVVLGRTEPHEFLMCYLSAREAQENEIAARNLRIRERGRTVLAKQLDEHIGMTVTEFNCDDPVLQRELELGNRFFHGDITAAASLYYVGDNKSYIEAEREKEILSCLEQYAICVAELGPLEV